MAGFFLECSSLKGLNVFNSKFLMNPLKVLAAQLMLGSSVSAFAAPPLTPQEQATVTYLESRGVTKFLLMNEKRGVLMTVDSGAVTQTLPALSGARTGDSRQTHPGSTPAQIFPLEISPRQEADDADMVFQRDPRGMNYVIHRLFANASADRGQRLNAAAPYTNPGRDRRISTGCISLRPKDYDLVSSFARTSRQTINGRDGQPYMTAPFLVVLPETSDPKATIEYFKAQPL